MMHQQV